MNGDFDHAMVIAAVAHRDQKDLAQESYIMHPIRVAQAVWGRGEAHRVVAILHDLVEDTSWTPQMLFQKGFSHEVVSAIEAITKRPGEAYQEYLDRVAGNSIACIVKLADLEDNIGRSWMLPVTEESIKRLAKYELAAAYLGAVQ